MTRAQLAAIANTMRQVATEEGFARRWVERTYVSLLLSDAHRTLTIGRLDSVPDPDDAQQIAEQFGAPCDDPGHIKLSVHAQDGKLIDIKALRYTWTEA